MDWHFLFLGLLQGFAFLFTKEALALPRLLNQGHLVFLQNSKCIYSYEVAVHTARGSKSTESDGYQLHALVSKFILNYLVLVIKKIYARRRKKCLFGTFDQENRITFSDVPLLSENSTGTTQKAKFIYFPAVFINFSNCPKLFVNGEPPLCHPAWPQYMQLATESATLEVYSRALDF